MIHVMPMRLPLLALSTLLAASASASAAEVTPYLRATLGLDFSSDATFRDPDCAARHPPAYFGCGTGDDGRAMAARGDFGNSTPLALGLGLELTSWLRIEANLEARPDLAFSGQVNFPGVGDDQPVRGSLNQADAMAFAYIEPLAAFGMETKLRPFLGLGAGVSRNEISDMTYAFPDVAQPRYTIVPGGTHVDFAWSAAAGVAYRASEHVTLELAYRYSDLGSVETAEGDMQVQRPSGLRRFEIAKTVADLTTQSVTVSARFGF